MISSTYSYKCKYVRHITTQSGKNITTFSIGDKVKMADGQEGSEFINYSVTVWGKLDLQDGQKVRIDKITNVSCEYYRGRNGLVKQFKMTAECTPITGDGEFTPPPTDEEAPRFRQEVTSTGKQAEPFFPGTDEDPNFKIPFDI